MPSARQASTVPAIKDTGYPVPVTSSAGVSLGFDPGARLLDDTASAVYVVEVADAPNAAASDAVLLWVEIGRVQWRGGNNPGPFPLGNAVLPPKIVFVTDTLAGRRVRWRAISDSIGLATADLGML